jgi:putative transposase
MRTGCQWREMSDHLPPWMSCYQYYLKLVRGKYLDKILFKLNKKSQSKQVRNLHILVTDSQSVHSTEYLPICKKGYDGYKKKYGLKRFTLVDTHGKIHGVYTTPANVSEKIGLKAMIEKYRSILKNKPYSLFEDKGFESKLLYKQLQDYGFTLYAMRSTRRLKRGTQWDYEQNNLHNYLNKQISRMRYVVERTFAWLNKCRRLVINYERDPRNHEGFVKLAMIRLLVRRMG